MFILYDLIFLILVIITLPVYILKGKFHTEFFKRFGVLPKGLELDRPIWVHAVSVGEAVVVRGLVDELRKVYPGKKFVISTVTPTGNKIAKDLVKDADLLTYLPLDFSFIVRSVMQRINPQLFIIAETEIWPNLISVLNKKGIPIVTVNGRISDSSFKGYRVIKFLIKNILAKVNLFCTQTDSDAKRLIALGVDPDKIKVTGNMKFDQINLVRTSDYRKRLGLSPEEKLFVAGSTHSGEEGVVIGVYKKILDIFPNVKLLIAPRHPQRAKDIELLARSFGFFPVKTSELSTQCVSCLQKPVFILDTVGELVNFYSASDIVFVGGSLIKKGGHNILEPASLGKPVIFGPYMFNFRDIAQMFIDNNAAIQVHNQEELFLAVENLLKNTQKVLELNSQAREVIIRNQGATLRSVQAIKGVLC
ncbi:MAG: 3-deoxy-D-manno-octulosonic acid transferase [Candidatus Omnitrophica bacterium]|nr:3-deoxy-D-manno-octulosonic acid transferase [Candidatus Omnitrophota bacterium]